MYAVERTIRIFLPKWAIALYVLMALILIPWIFDLASSLPSRHLEQHWGTVWVGFDVIMLIAIILTLYFMIKRTVWVVVSATALATLMVIDAWFDVMTAKPGAELREAILSAVLELSLAVLTYHLVYAVVHHATPRKSFSLHVKGGRR
jgi:hypothetical protein